MHQVHTRFPTVAQLPAFPHPVSGRWPPWGQAKAMSACDYCGDHHVALRFHARSKMLLCDECRREFPRAMARSTINDTTTGEAELDAQVRVRVCQDRRDSFEGPEVEVVVLLGGIEHDITESAIETGEVQAILKEWGLA